MSQSVIQSYCYILIISSSFHCTGTWTPKVVFESTKGNNLFSAASFKSMCELEKTLWKSVQSSSITSHVTAMTNTTCTELTSENVRYVEATLKSCVQFYHSGDLANSCQGLKAKNIFKDHTDCCRDNHIYEILHFFTDDKFMTKEKPDNTFLTFSMSYLHVCTDVVEFYRKHLEYSHLSNDHIRIAGIDIGWAKASLFSDYLVQDLLFFGIAMLMIVVIMCAYMRSLTLTLATVFNVIFSFLLAYFIYHVVLRIPFFPFLNSLSGLVLIAVGADDVFIFYDTWFQARDNILGTPIEHILTKTFHHAILSIFITSLTTAAAFISNAVSSITAIKCFGIFSGVAILANFIMMVTWIPAIFVLWSQCNFKLCRKLCNGDACVKCIQKVTNCISMFFNKIMPLMITRAWFVWLFLFTMLGTGGIILVFVHPRLNLPSSQEFQLFGSHTPIERYAQMLKNRFRCIKEDTKLQPGIDIHIVWGLKAEDNGNWLDPQDYGSLVQDESFDLSSQNALQWLGDFCDVIKKQTFVNSASVTSKDCLIKSFLDEFTSPCLSPMFQPCCDQPSNNQNSTLLNMCLHRTHIRMLQSIPIGTLYFDSNNQIKVFEMIVESNQIFSTSFNDMDMFFKSVDKFVSNALIDAPAGLKTGWFIGFHENSQFGGTLDFYDLQIALSTGTYIAIAVSLAFAAVVMLLTSLNVVITLFAIICITLSIFATVGSLVLLGWELNILESVTLSLGVGLSIDFSIHYGMAYRMSKENKRHLRVEASLRTVGAAVTMAALTTFLAGSAVMPSKIISYTQLGTFLMLVMFFSWTFSTFFFQSLCAVLGPQGNCGQIPFPRTSKQDRISTDRSSNNGCSSVTPSDLAAAQQNGTSGHHEMVIEGKINPAFQLHAESV